MPSRRRGRDRPGLVLEHPAPEVAPSPCAAGCDDADRAAGTALVAKDGTEPLGHPVVGEEVVAHRPLVSVRDEVGLCSPAADDRLGGEPAGEQRLTDALAGQHVGRGGGVADEEDPAVGE